MSRTQFLIDNGFKEDDALTILEWYDKGYSARYVRGTYNIKHVQRAYKLIKNHYGVSKRQ